MLVHVSESAPSFTSVRGGSGRLVTTDFVKELCDIADKFCDGYLRFTSRNNVEFLLTDQSKIAGLKDACKKMASPWAPPVIPSATSFIPGLGPLPYRHHDASGIVKAVMDDCSSTSAAPRQPQTAGMVRIALACCQNVRRGCTAPTSPSWAFTAPRQGGPRETAPSVRNPDHDSLLPHRRHPAHPRQGPLRAW